MTTKPPIYDVSFSCDQIHDPYIDIPSGTIVLPEYYENVEVISSSRKHVTFTCDDTFMAELGAKTQKLVFTLTTLVNKVVSE